MLWQTSPAVTNLELYPLTAPLRVHLVRNATYGSEMELDGLPPALTQVAQLWQQANIALDLQLCHPVAIETSTLEAAFAGHFLPLTQVAGYSRDSLNLFLLGQAAPPDAHQTDLAMVICADSPASPPLTRGLARLLHLQPHLSLTHKEMMWARRQLVEIVPPQPMDAVLGNSPWLRVNVALERISSRLAGIWRQAKICLVADNQGIPLQDHLPPHQQAHQLSTRLGLTPTAWPERLSCPDSRGILLSPEEVATARSAALLLFDQSCPPQPQPAEVAPPPWIEGELRFPLKLRLVRNPNYGSILDRNSLTLQLAAAQRWWTPANIRLDCVAVEECEVPDASLLEAFPRPPGLASKAPVNFALMRLGGHDARALSLFCVRRLPHQPHILFAPSKMLLLGEEGNFSLSLAVGLAELLGLEAPPNDLGQAESARARLKRMFGA